MKLHDRVQIKIYSNRLFNYRPQMFCTMLARLQAFLLPKINASIFFLYEKLKIETTSITHFYFILINRFILLYHTYAFISQIKVF